MDSSVYINGMRYRNRVFVGGLIKTTNAADIAKYFSEFGKVLDAKVVFNDNGNSKGYGFVTFNNEKSVKSVLNACPLYFNGKKLNIGPAIRKQAPDCAGESVLVLKTPKIKFYPPNKEKPYNNSLDPSHIIPLQNYTTVPYFIDNYGTTYFF
ncbi:deleted in azoospermia protein 4 isoform X1 [Hydra vulgaris]|uniref:deleted in azoospermia protein 4 isoform X1 n=1 Tax=Hydra vulgaris TaxID=6087 RepID=UPI000640DD47|nr:deleted in azoospermia protein 4 [Hydra vulgaris]